MNIGMMPISKRQRAHFYIFKKQVNNKTLIFIYKKQETFQKSRQFTLRFFSQNTWHFTLHKFPWNIWNIHLYIYKKHDILRCVKFLYTKIPKLQTKARKIALRFLYTKKLTLFLNPFFVNFCNQRRGEGIFMNKKGAHCIKFIYAKKWDFW